jgi:hypothetical protein
MSTTFGILRDGIDHNKIVDDEGELLDYISENVFEPIWFRTMKNSRWLNAVGPYLIDDAKVYALDNSQQGIYTIGDIKEYMKKQDEENS